MKLAFSNIAWDQPEEPDVLPILSQAGIEGIEIAPTKYWPGWQGAAPEALAHTVARLTAAGFSIPSLQSILFGRPELKLFGSENERGALLDHVAHVAAIARELGAKVLVFGSPGNRDPGSLEPAAAMRAAVPVLRMAGDVCARNGIRLGIEANPAAYGCKFVTRWFEAAELVRACDNPGIRLHLDAACTALAGDDLVEAVSATRDILVHVHISEPHLGAFDNPTVNHGRFGEALKSAGYRGWCSVEMRRTIDPVSGIRAAANIAKACYA